MRLFQVVEEKQKKTKIKKKIHFFTLKAQAKEKRDFLINSGQKNACIEKGPDHDKHIINRPEAGWNRGKHPKKGHKGQKSFWKK